jgi:glycosyltransferase involved in cell wall biosynthesis
MLRSPTNIKKIRAFIVCSGLGQILRGYESFFRDCFDALRDDPRLDLYLFKGAGKDVDKEKHLWNLPREGRPAKSLGGIVARGGYFVEQCTFFLSLVPHLLIKKPDVVYVSDVVLANLLRIYKRACKAGYHVLFNNNGPVNPPILTRWDHIQQVSPQYLKEALNYGLSAERQTLLPSGVEIPVKLTRLGDHAKSSLRMTVGLPADRRIILSVGFLSKTRKRMDYVIREIAKLPEPRPFLLLLGHEAGDTQSIIDLGNSLLTNAGFSVRTVAKAEVHDYYRLADIFTLASMEEGFGLVYVEALSHGLPCLVHDYETARYVVGPMGYYANFSEAGTLANLVAAVGPEECSEQKAKARHAYALAHFGWSCLAPKYVDLLIHCANVRRTQAQARASSGSRGASPWFP